MGFLGSDVEDIRVEWDSNKGRPFYPGETAKGSVTLKTNKEGVKIQRLSVTLTGRVEVKWTEVRSPRIAMLWDVQKLHHFSRGG